MLTSRCVPAGGRVIGQIDARSQRSKCRQWDFGTDLSHKCSKHSGSVECVRVGPVAWRPRSPRSEAADHMMVSGPAAVMSIMMPRWPARLGFHLSCSGLVKSWYFTTHIRTLDVLVDVLFVLESCNESFIDFHPSITSTFGLNSKY